MNKLNIEGLISATFTPMYEDGTLNLSEIENYANFLKKSGVAGVFICGTTGEGILMDEDERKAVATEWLKFKTADFKVIVHVGAPSYLQAVKLADHAQQIGADAIAAMGPVFLSPTDVVSLVDYWEPIANAAPNLPFYYYHMPPVSHVSVSMKEFLIEADKRIPNLAGIKFTHNDLMEMQQCMELFDGQFEILHGYDEVLLGGLALGAKGSVGSTYNYMASCYYKIVKDFNQENNIEARKGQLYSVKAVKNLMKYGGGVRAGKEIMSLMGIAYGPCRAPIKKMNEEEKLNLKKLIFKSLFKHIGE